MIQVPAERINYRGTKMTKILFFLWHAEDICKGQAGFLAELRVAHQLLEERLSDGFSGVSPEPFRSSIPRNHLAVHIFDGLSVGWNEQEQCCCCHKHYSAEWWDEACRLQTWNIAQRIPSVWPEAPAPLTLFPSGWSGSSSSSGLAGDWWDSKEDILLKLSRTGTRNHTWDFSWNSIISVVFILLFMRGIVLLSF